MDLKILAKSLGLNEDSSEEAINAHIATLKIKAEAHDQSQADAQEKGRFRKRRLKTKLLFNFLLKLSKR